MDETKKTKWIAFAFGGLSLGLMVFFAITHNRGATTDGTEALARVGERDLTEAEFEAYLAFKRIAPRDQAQGDRVLQDLVDREALAQAISHTDLLDQSALEAELEEFRREQLIARYFDQYLRDAVTDAAVLNFYESHVADYEERKAHVAHVLVRTNPRMSEQERQAALTQAREAYSRLQAGEELAAVASELSEDRVTAARAEDLGWVREGTISARFSEVAFSLEPGTVSEPFETPFGYHVVRVLEAPQTVRRPLEAVQAEIRTRLRQEAKEAEVERLRGTVEREVREGAYVVRPAGMAATEAGDVGEQG